MSEYLSVADFAEAAGVTKQAVYRRLDTNLKEFVRIEQGKRYVSEDALSLFNVDYSVDANIENDVENIDQGLNNVEQQEVETVDPTIDPRDSEISRLLSLLESSQAENRALNERLMTLTLEIAAMGKSAQVIAAQTSGVPLLNNVEQRSVENIESEVENIVQAVEQPLNNVEQAVEKEKASRFPGWLRWLVNRYEA